MIVLNCITMILLFERSFADKHTLPVFMIDQDQVMGHLEVDSNPFNKITAASFADIIHESIKRSESIVLFIEDSLSTEDISSKDKFGTPFSSLRTGLSDNSVKYFPSVMEPYKLLNQVFQPQQHNVFYLRSHTKMELKDNYKYMYIFFQDGVNETRSDILRRHDAIIRDVLFIVRQLKPGPIVAFYTGKINPVVVKKKDFVPIKPHPVPKDLGVMIVSTGALFRFTGVFAATTTRRAMFNQLPLISDETYKPRRMSTKMAYTDFELEFNFSFQEKGWLIDSVALLEAGEEVGRTEMGVGAPWNWSYVCGEPLVIINTRDGSSITISQYQIQPRSIIYRRSMRAIEQSKKKLLKFDSSDIKDKFYRQDDESGAPNQGDGTSQVESEKKEADTSKGKEDTCFGPTINCGPYFNTSILSGLFVTFLCFGITMYGVVALMDIRANDRYEDPNSKPLQHAFT